MPASRNLRRASASGFLAEPVGQDRRQTLGPRRPRDRVDDGLRRFARRGERRRAIHDENGVGVAVGKHGVDRGVIAFGLCVADDVDRVGPRPVGGKDLVELATSSSLSGASRPPERSDRRPRARRRRRHWSRSGARCRRPASGRSASRRRRTAPRARRRAPARRAGTRRRRRRRCRRARRYGWRRLAPTPCAAGLDHDHRLHARRRARRRHELARGGMVSR